MAQLKREIGFKALLVLAVNAIIGAEIFFLPAIGAAYAGPASLISWILASVVAVSIAIYFAELVSMFPRAGGVYEFAKRSFGELPSFIIGWIAWVIANITIAMCIVAAVHYLLPGASVYVNLLISFSFILFFNFVNYIGIKQSKRLLLFLGAATFFAIFSLTVPGFGRVDLGNFSPFFVFPTSSIFLALFFVVQAFFGWESILYLAEEIKDARKVLPKILVLATIATVAIALALVFVSLGIVNWAVLSNVDAPLSYLASILFGEYFGKIFAILVFIPLIGEAAGWIVSSPRLLFAMARDKLFIPSVQNIHHKYRTPHIAILFQTVATSVVTVIAFGSFKTLLSLLIPLVLILYSLALFCVVKLRIARPEIKRNFRAPFAKFGPILIILFNFYLISVWLQEAEAVSLLGWDILLVLIGLPVYVSVKLYTDRKFVEKFWDRLSFFLGFYLSLLCRKEEVKKVLENAELRKGLNVLDYGSGTGVLTEKISRMIGNGRVVAADLSKKQLKRTVKRAERLELLNVVFVKLSKPAPFGRGTFDRIVSTIAINYFVSPENELRALANVLKRNGKASFLALGAPLITMHAFLKCNSTIKTIFKTAGFSDVSIERVKRIGTEYIYIKARK